MRPAGCALRLRARRQAIRHECAAAAHGNGAHIRTRGDARGGRWRLGRESQRVRPHRRDGLAGGVWLAAAVAAPHRPGDAAAGGLRQSPVAGLSTGHPGQGRACVAASRSRRRVSVGAVRGADSGVDPHRGSASRCQRDHDVAAGYLRGRCSHLAGSGAARRRSRSDGAQEIARRRRVDPPGLGSGCVGIRSGRRHGAGYRAAHSPVAERHREPRAGAGGPGRASRRPASRRVDGGEQQHGRQLDGRHPFHGRRQLDEQQFHDGGTGARGSAGAGRSAG